MRALPYPTLLCHAISKNHGDAYNAFCTLDKAFCTFKQYSSLLPTNFVIVKGSITRALLVSEQCPQQSHIYRPWGNSRTLQKLSSMQFRHTLHLTSHVFTARTYSKDFINTSKNIQKISHLSITRCVELWSRSSIHYVTTS
jgi:hypothetical protein